MKWLLLLSLSTSLWAQTFPIKVSGNGRYFVDQSSRPFFLVADSAWDIIGNIPPADWSTYIAARQRQHFNTIFFSALCNGYILCSTRNSNTANYDGDKPFTSGSSTSDYDFSTPNPTYWQKLDTLVNTLCNAGFVVMLDPVPSDVTWMTTMRNNGETKTYNYGAFIGNRYKDVPCIVYSLGNDFQYYGDNGMDGILMTRLAQGIASTDRNHIQTSTLTFMFSYTNQYSGWSSVMNYDLCYTYYGAYDCIYQARLSGPTIPVFLGESNYEGENNNSALPGPATAYDIRLQNYWTFAYGGAGVQYGNHPVWLFGSGWQSHLNDSGAQQIQHLVTLAGVVPWYNFSPDSTHKVVTAGYGSYRGTDLNIENENYCSTAWDGITHSVTYCPQSSRVTVALSAFAFGPLRARWFDPTTGKFTTIGNFGNSGTHDFTSPSAHSDGKSDWVLVLDPSPTVVSSTINGRSRQ